MDRFIYLLIALASVLVPLSAAELDDITIINGSYGGGWELTAQVTGNTLISLGLINKYKIETLEGGAGWRALEMFTSDDEHKEDILIQSEPLISGFLKKKYRIGFRNLKPLALLAAEYSCVIVAKNSHYKDFSDVLTAMKNNPGRVPISLGGRRGTGDHLTANMIFKAAGINKATGLRYVFSDGGDRAAIRLLKDSKNIVAVSGYNSIISDALRKNEIRVIGITSSNRVDGHMTLKEQGVDIEYANWRGFFARKDISDEKYNMYLNALKALSSSAEWKLVLNENAWSPFFKSGSELTAFLILHEKALKVTMQELNIIE